MRDDKLQLYKNRLYNDTVMWYEYITDIYLKRDTKYKLAGLSSEALRKEQEGIWQYAYYLASHCIENREPILFYERLAHFEEEHGYTDIAVSANADLKASIDKIINDVESSNETVFLLDSDLEIVFRYVYTLTWSNYVNANKESETYTTLVTLLHFIDRKVGLKEDEIDIVRVVRGALALCDRDMLYKTFEIFSSDIMHLLSFLQLCSNSSNKQKKFCEFCNALIHMYVSDSQDKREKYYKTLNVRMISQCLLLDQEFIEVFGAEDGICMLKMILCFITKQMDEQDTYLYVPDSYEAAKLYWLSNDAKLLDNDVELRFSRYINNPKTIRMPIDNTKECDIMYEILMHIKAVNECVRSRQPINIEKQKGIKYLQSIMQSGKVIDLLNLKIV